MTESAGNKTFDHASAQLTDKITVVGCCEHLYEHALKTASNLPEEKAVFYLTLASMVQEFRRDFTKEHFPKVTDEDWCIVKAADTLRQRVYESSNDSYEDIKRVNEIWSTGMGHVFGVDLSGCSACREDKGAENKESEPTQSEAPNGMLSNRD